MKVRSPAAILAILALINFINYVDRQVIAPLAVLLVRPESEGGLGLSQTQFGLLYTAFMIVHSLASVPLGILADKFARTRLIAVGVGVWSMATALAAFARSFAGLFVARAAVGIGEATYAPAASALISDTFSPAARARALGIFQVGMVLGGAVGVVIGGIVGGKYGWRAAFLVVGLPGLVLAALALLIVEPRRGRAAAAAGGSEKAEAGADPHGRHRREPGTSLAMEARELVRSPALVWINVAGILITFFTGALLAWVVKFIIGYHYGGDASKLAQVTLTFGIIATAASIMGTLAGSFVADRIEKRRPGEGRLLAIAIGTFATAPCAVAALWAPSRPLLLALLTLGVFFNVWYVGPVLAALHDVVPAKYRGTATGAYFLLIHLLGDAISPAIVGMVADATHSLRIGLLVAIAVLVLGGIAALCAIPGSRRIARLKGAHGAG